MAPPQWVDTLAAMQGVAQVFDTTAGRNFSLIETAAEFVHRYRSAHPGAAKPDALSGLQHNANGERSCLAHDTFTRMI